MRLRRNLFDIVVFYFNLRGSRTNNLSFSPISLTLSIMNRAFTVAALKSINTVGAVSPSSKYLANRMTRLLDERTDYIVELGAGTGAITRRIAAKAPSSCKIDSLEIDPELYVQLSSDRGMAGYENLHFHLRSAYDFRSCIDQGRRPDLIISSLPLALLPKQQVMRMLIDCREVLKGGGAFVQFQYSPESLGLLRKVFEEVHVSVEVRNIPPALVYTCR
jgi:phospholipid N-methyltransferase